MSTLHDVDVVMLSKRVKGQLNYVRKIVEEAVPADCVTTSISAEMRYKGQGFELSVELDGKADFAAELLKLEATFIKRYEKLVGFYLQDVPIEIVSISVSARELRKTDEPEILQDSIVAAEETRNIYDLNSQDYIEYRVFKRRALSRDAIDGPAVVSEAQTTTLVRPNWSVHRSEIGHLVLERGMA